MQEIFPKSTQQKEDLSLKHSDTGISLPKTQKRQNTCPECGTPAKEPYKTWELIAPFQTKTRVTVTILGMHECPKGGEKFRDALNKTKLGSEAIQP